MLVEDFWTHVATDGSLLGVSGRRSACGSSFVQLAHDEEVELLLRYSAPSRGLRRPSFDSSQRIVGPTTAHVDNKGVIDGLWRGENEVHWPKSEGVQKCGF